jgi:sec-independent protein translocase protein TatA
VIAFLSSLGWQEMLLLLVIGILLYGRNLPEAGRSLGRVAAQLRRGFQEFKDQMNRDADLREMKKTLHDTANEVRRVADVPRALRDPGSTMRQFAKDALADPPVEPDPEAQSTAPSDQAPEPRS